MATIAAFESETSEAKDPESSRRQIEDHLLLTLRCARQNFKSNLCSVDEYLKALFNLNNFFLDGKLPSVSQPQLKVEFGG